MNLPEPILEEKALRFCVTFSLKRLPSQKAIDEKEEKIMKLICASEAKGGISTSKISKEIGISDRAIRDRLSRMIKAGRIVAISKSAYDPGKNICLQKNELTKLFLKKG